MKTKLLAVAVVILLGVNVGAFGQVAGGTSGTSGTQSGPATRSPEETSGVGKNARIDQGLDRGLSGDYLTGTVRVEGNPLLWEPIPVTVYCDGTARSQVYADGKGHFEFKSTPVLGTPQNPKQIKLTAQWVGCTVSASLAGYRSTVLTIANRNMTDNPNIGTVQLTKDEHAHGSVLSTTSNTAPKKALKAFEKAREEMMNQKPDNAEKELKKAVKFDPQFATAWYELGRLQRNSSPKDAYESFMKAASADPQYLPPYEPLAEIEALQGKWNDVAMHVTHALQLDAEGTPQLWYYDALSKFNLKDRKGAEESAKKSLAMDPNHLAPNTEQLLAVIEAGRGDYAHALEHLKHTLTYLPAGPSADLVKQQIGQLESQIGQAK